MMQVGEGIRMQKRSSQKDSGFLSWIMAKKLLNKGHEKALPKSQ